MGWTTTDYTTWRTILWVPEPISNTAPPCQLAWLGETCWDKKILQLTPTQRGNITFFLVNQRMSNLEMRTLKLENRYGLSHRKGMGEDDAPEHGMKGLILSVTCKPNEMCKRDKRCISDDQTTTTTCQLLLYQLSNPLLKHLGEASEEYNVDVRAWTRKDPSPSCRPTVSRHICKFNFFTSSITHRYRT